tara:strand:- start:58 stop:342 length:285 start_codon:yes stop_codon:yes gene_type:complete
MWKDTIKKADTSASEKIVKEALEIVYNFSAFPDVMEEVRFKMLRDNEKTFRSKIGRENSEVLKELFKLAYKVEELYDELEEELTDMIQTLVYDD